MICGDIITLKCTSCGAEVVIDTSESTQARCHWCRNNLSVNEQIPNGAVPDVVLPFSVTKAQAKEQIESFVGKRKFFAHPKFRDEFKTDNIMGVYFPYMVVDVNSHAYFSGYGEHEVRRYFKGTGNDRRMYYDANLYEIEREFDLTIEGLTVEASSDKLNKQSNKTNNVINAIMPFDIENSAKYNANYLKGYTSERRDTNIDELRGIVDNQSIDIARFAANDTLGEYDRGVKWDIENLDVKGKQWKTAYLPVWLYSYMQVNGDKSILHYVAVNGRTKEAMGSVPIHMPKLLGVSCGVEILGFILMMIIKFKYKWIFAFAGFIYFFFNYLRYRNSNQRHHHETRTKKNLFNLRKVDTLIKNKKGLSNSKMQGANNKKVSGKSISESISDTVMNSFNKF